jgi:competence ComEA-like helix-hairpin-helix protein
MQANRLTIGVLISGQLAVSVCAAALAQKHPPAKPIDLNLANAKELQELPGVGPVTAQRIIAMREKSGRFHRVEDLLAVCGISQKKLDAMRLHVNVSPALPRREVVHPQRNNEALGKESEQECPRFIFELQPKAICRA